MRTAAPLGALAAGLILAAGCVSSTRIVESWTAPGLQPSDLAFQHIVAIAALREPSRQRIAEDALAVAVTRATVTPAYTIVSQEDRADTARLRSALERHGIDGAITVRLIGVDEKETYVPGQTRVYPGGYYGYWGSVGRVVYEPGYVRRDTYVSVETSLYDVAKGELLWSGVSETLNPQDVDEVIEGIVSAARKELEEKKLLP